MGGSWTGAGGPKCLKQGRILLSACQPHLQEFFFKWIQCILSQRYIKNGTEAGWSSNSRA